jgi:vacuolar-type H+-ATPase subunit H
LEAKGEKLLQELVNQEQELVKKVDAAKKKAAKILEDAHAESASIMERAREKGDATVNERVTKAKEEARQVHEEITVAAQKQVEVTQAQAKKGMKKAVDLVMERVLP